MVVKLRLDRNRVVLRLRDPDYVPPASAADVHVTAAALTQTEPRNLNSKKTQKNVLDSLFDSDEEDASTSTGAAAAVPATQITPPAALDVSSVGGSSESAKKKKGKASSTGAATGAAATAATLGGRGTHSGMVEVEIDLGLSAYANARNLYTQKKVAYDKEVKSIDIAAKVMSRVSDKMQQEVQSQKLKRDLKAIRKVYL
jgi:hypothetical protein